MLPVTKLYFADVGDGRVEDGKGRDERRWGKSP
jgi:hypothetical protein